MGQLVFQAALGGAVNLIGPNISATTNFTLPGADGTNGQALTTNGSGTLGFSSIVSGAAGSNTQVQFNSGGNFGASSSLTWDGTYLTAGSIKDSALTSGRVTYATTSGLLTDSANLTFNGTTLTANTLNLTNALGTGYGGTGLTSFTSGGVVYASSTSALATGSALTFDGTTLGLGNSPTAYKFEITTSGNNGLKLNAGTASADQLYFGNTGGVPAIGTLSSSALTFIYGGSEQMRLTSTGLGIGTSSPTYKLDVYSASGAQIGIFNSTTGTGSGVGSRVQLIGGTKDFALVNREAASIQLYTSDTLRATLDSAGNLGLGVTPSAWSLTNASALQIRNAGFMGYSNNAYLSANLFNSAGTWKYISGSSAATLYSGNSGAHEFYVSTGTPSAGATATLTQAMTLTASGELLLGTTSTGGALRVYGATGKLIIGDSNFNYFDADTQIFRNSSATERARIDSSGNLLLGTTNSSDSAGNGFKVVPVTAGTSAPQVSIVGNSTSGSFLGYTMYSSANSTYRFYVGYNGTINAQSTTITAISDVRLKENIRDLDEGLATVMALKPRKFDWKEGKGQDIKNARGFIAQEFETVLPDMIEEWKDPAPEGEEAYKAINANLIPTLVKAMQEQQAIIESLKARLDAANL